MLMRCANDVKACVTKLKPFVGDECEQACSQRQNTTRNFAASPPCNVRFDSAITYAG